MSDIQSQPNPWIAPQSKKADEGTSQVNPEWDMLEPETLPNPTYWPVVMALGITFLAMGFVTSFLISGVGLLLFAISLAGWIGEIIHERQK